MGLSAWLDVGESSEYMVYGVWMGLRGRKCCKGGLFISCEWSVLKQLESVMGEDAKNELETLGRPNLSQIHAMLLLTYPVYNSVKELMQLT